MLHWGGGGCSAGQSRECADSAGGSAQLHLRDPLMVYRVFHDGFKNLTLEVSVPAFTFLSSNLS